MQHLPANGFAAVTSHHDMPHHSNTYPHTIAQHSGDHTQHRRNAKGGMHFFHFVSTTYTRFQPTLIIVLAAGSNLSRRRAQRCTATTDNAHPASSASTPRQYTPAANNFRVFSHFGPNMPTQSMRMNTDEPARAAVPSS